MHRGTVTIYYRNSLIRGHEPALATNAMAQYLAEEAMRQRSTEWPKDPQDYVIKNTSPAPQQPDGTSCGCCVLMGLEALCAGDALDGTGRFRSMPDYTSLDVARWRARWQCILLRETHAADTTNKSLAAAQAEHDVVDLTED
jgi:Ulp1 family protease